MNGVREVEEKVHTKREVISWLEYKAASDKNARGLLRLIVRALDRWKRRGIVIKMYICVSRSMSRSWIDRCSDRCNKGKLLVWHLPDAIVATVTERQLPFSCPMALYFSFSLLYFLFLLFSFFVASFFKHSCNLDHWLISLFVYSDDRSIIYYTDFNALTRYYSIFFVTQY